MLKCVDSVWFCCVFFHLFCFISFHFDSQMNNGCFALRSCDTNVQKWWQMSGRFTIWDLVELDALMRPIFAIVPFQHRWESASRYVIHRSSSKRMAMTNKLAPWFHALPAMINDERLHNFQWIFQKKHRNWLQNIWHFFHSFQLNGHFVLFSFGTSVQGKKKITS